MMDRLFLIGAGFNRRFQNGHDPFQVMTRLLEECGELAAEVNHFEGMGVKREKHGEPDRQHLAKEIVQVVVCALQLVMHYQVESELDEAIEWTYERLRKEGYIE